MNPSVETARLERNAVGLAPTLFQSITHMAPAAAVAFSIIVGVPYAGGSMPLAVVLALVACILVAISVGQLARHMPSAGGLYTYNARGLGSGAGLLVAWGLLLAAPLGEEARDPRRTIPAAVVLSCLLIGAFYVLTTYAASVYFGPGRMADPKHGFITLNGGDPWTGMATQVWGPLGVLVILAVVNS